MHAEHILFVLRPRLSGSLTILTTSEDLIASFWPTIACVQRTIRLMIPGRLMAAAKEFFCQPYLEPLRFPRPLRSPWHRLSNTDLALRCPSSRWVNRSLLPLFPAKAARVQRRRLTSTPRDKTKKTADDSTRKCGELFFFSLFLIIGGSLVKNGRKNLWTLVFIHSMTHRTPVFPRFPPPPSSLLAEQSF